MSGFAIGVDLGGTNLRVAVITAEGELLEKVTASTKALRVSDRVLDVMAGEIRRLSSKHSGLGPLFGIGIGIPGILDLGAGILRKSPNLPGWEDCPVRDEIERRIGASVVLDNDANAAAMGEFWLGAGRGHDSLFMFTQGTGVGGGIVLNGTVWHGMTGMAGEPGHMTVEPDGPPCAPTPISGRNRMREPSVSVARSLATHLAGSWILTRASLTAPVTSSAGRRPDGGLS